MTELRLQPRVNEKELLRFPTLVVFTNVVLTYDCLDPCVKYVFVLVFSMSASAAFPRFSNPPNWKKILNFTRFHSFWFFFSTYVNHFK